MALVRTLDRGFDAVKESEIDVEGILGTLKEFQRRSVDYVFRRLYTDAHTTTRFLVADEVGLGKTMVARGLIAKTVDYLRREKGVKRIDIVYICSNAAIAKQNINRLNIFRDAEFQHATRLTLLPVRLKNLRENAVNFISFTPDTSFDLKSKGGRSEERVLLYFLLKSPFRMDARALSKFLRMRVTAKSWRKQITRFSEKIDPTLKKAFVQALRDDATLLARLRGGCRNFADLGRRRSTRELTQERNHVIGELRQTLARACVHALAPDLIILDEFQRFRRLLEIDDPDEATELARVLMQYRDTEAGTDARVVLLSATPYRMLTLRSDGEEEDHYADFINTMRFMLEDRPEAIGRLEADLRTLRRGMLSDGQVSVDTEAAHRRVEALMRSVMVRTERVSATVRRDAMLTESLRPARLETEDLRRAADMGRIAEAVGAGNIVEYWKSSPYLLNLMRDYQFKMKLRDQAERPSTELRSAVRDALPSALTTDAIQRYEKLDPGNARLRSLLGDFLDAGLWRCLWLPPSLPYYEPRGAFFGVESATKALVFSSWNVVPDAIAAVGSYEAERRMLELHDDKPAYADLHEKQSQLLQFKISRERLSGMNTLALLYPSPALASLVDPLEIALEIARGEVPTAEQIMEIARERVRDALVEAGVPLDNGGDDGRDDQAWYCAALAHLDRRFDGKVEEWCESTSGWHSTVIDTDNVGDTGFDAHIEHFLEALTGELELGRVPDDLVEVVTEFALAGPGICALRTLGRLMQDRDLVEHEMLQTAARIADGYRSQYNLPAVTTMLRAERPSIPYWRVVLHYGIDGNVQAVLDEYLHILRDSLGLSERQDDEALEGISEAACEALSLRTSRVRVDEVSLKNGRIEIGAFNVRARFALRFGDIKDDAGQALARAGSVRQAFTSPFQPFILATTSVGQEGLDFHPYCHALYHWNLPSNPVDLEQREGRVQRYKGHAVRKNVARNVGLDGLVIDWDGRGDPWARLFCLAADGVQDRAGDLIPYWIYEIEGGATIERRIPELPLSREVAELARLKRGVALYRLVFGQPRQEELLSYLEERAGGLNETARAKLIVSLAPPEIP